MFYNKKIVAVAVIIEKKDDIACTESIVAVDERPFLVTFLAASITTVL